MEVLVDERERRGTDGRSARLDPIDRRIEGAGWQAAQGRLRFGNPAPEWLGRASAELVGSNHLPVKRVKLMDETAELDEEGDLAIADFFLEHVTEDRPFDFSHDYK